MKWVGSMVDRIRNAVLLQRKSKKRIYDTTEEWCYSSIIQYQNKVLKNITFNHCLNGKYAIR